MPKLSDEVLTLLRAAVDSKIEVDNNLTAAEKALGGGELTLGLALTALSSPTYRQFPINLVQYPPPTDVLAIFLLDHQNLQVDHTIPPLES